MFVYETIGENSEAFVDPKLNKIGFILNVFVGDHEDSLEDLGDISEVECVVGFLGSRKELFG